MSLDNYLRMWFHNRVLSAPDFHAMEEQQQMSGALGGDWDNDSRSDGNGPDHVMDAHQPPGVDGQQHEVGNSQPRGKTEGQDPVGRNIDGAERDDGHKDGEHEDSVGEVGREDETHEHQKTRRLPLTPIALLKYAHSDHPGEAEPAFEMLVDVSRQTPLAQAFAQAIKGGGAVPVAVKLVDMSAAPDELPSSDLALDDDDEPAPKRRKVGRLRKQPQAPPAAKATPAKSTPRRKVGRPKKHAPQLLATPALKRKVGRPKKHSPGPVAEPTTPKRKVGRPKKTSA